MLDFLFLLFLRFFFFSFSLLFGFGFGSRGFGGFGGFSFSFFLGFFSFFFGFLFEASSLILNIALAMATSSDKKIKTWIRRRFRTTRDMRAFGKYRRVSVATHARHVGRRGFIDHVSLAGVVLVSIHMGDPKLDLLVVVVMAKQNCV